MKLNKLVPMMITNDLDGTIDFYEKKLGFKCINKTESWAYLECDAVEIMLTTPNKHVPFVKPEFTGSFYFYPDEVDKLYDQLKNNVPIAYPLESFEYGMREFEIYDNNGYMLQFGNQEHHNAPDQ